MTTVEKNLGGNIQEVREDLETLKLRVQQNEAGLDVRIESVLNKMSGPSTSGLPGNGVRPCPLSRAPQAQARPQMGPQTGAADDSRRQDAYWRARRSIRLWPVKCDLRSSLSIFLVDELDMDPDICEEIDSYEVRRVRSARGRVENEICVTFPNVETRDAVRAMAPNMAGKKMGMRLEIPEYLRPSLRALESMSYMMKQSNPQLKRNIKFDDERMDLVMDVRLAEDQAGPSYRSKKGKGCSLQGTDHGVGDRPPDSALTTTVCSYWSKGHWGRPIGRAGWRGSRRHLRW